MEVSNSPNYRKESRLFLNTNTKHYSSSKGDVRYTTMILACVVLRTRNIQSQKMLQTVLLQKPWAVGLFRGKIDHAVDILKIFKFLQCRMS